MCRRWFKLPENSAEDSNDILPLPLGEESELPDHSWVVNHDYGGVFAIRKGKWKLVGKDRLFDLDTDPKESKNVASQQPDLVAEMAAKLEKYKRLGHSIVRPEEERR